MKKGSPVPPVMKMPKPFTAAPGIEDVAGMSASSITPKLDEGQSQAKISTLIPPKLLQTVAKGVCGACEKPIVGQVLTAIDRTWHPKHFVCTHCQKEIGSEKFFEQEGWPYCEKDYHGLFSERCHHCNEPIKDEILFALEKTWQQDHLLCAQCGTPVKTAYYKKNEKALCNRECYDLFDAKCSGCQCAILEDYIPALRTLWHPECFVCSDCSTLFTDGIFFNHNRKLYCEKHYKDVQNTPVICYLQREPEYYMMNRASKIELGLFICTSCFNQVEESTFQKQNDKPYCQGCFVKLFS